MISTARKTISFGLAALLSLAMVPIVPGAHSTQAYADEAVTTSTEMQEVSEAISETASSEQAVNPQDAESLASEISTEEFDFVSEAKPVLRNGSYSDFTLTSGKKITYQTQTLADCILDFDFTLNDISLIEVTLNSYDHGYKYYGVSVFTLYDSNDETIDTVYVDHNQTIEAGWILPAGSYYIRYMSMDTNYKQTVSVSYNVAETGTANYQMVPSYLKTEAQPISIGSKMVLGVSFWGYAQTVAENNIDGHTYSINVTKKAPLDIVLSAYGSTSVVLYDASGNIIGGADTNGTSYDADAADYTSPTLAPGNYEIRVLTSDTRALGHPYLLSVNYAKTDTASTAQGTSTTSNPKATKLKGTSISKLTKGKKSFTVKWKKLSKANLKKVTGYQVRYSLKKSMKGAKTKTVKASSKDGKKCTLKVSKLKGGKKYYVQVRTYKKANGKTTYSSWSKAKTVITKKK